MDDDYQRIIGRVGVSKSGINQRKDEGEMRGKGRELRTVARPNHDFSM